MFQSVADFRISMITVISKLPPPVATFHRVCSTLLAPSDEGAGFCGAKDWGRDNPQFISLPPVSPIGETTSLPEGGVEVVRTRWGKCTASGCGGIVHSHHRDRLLVARQPQTRTAAGGCVAECSGSFYLHAKAIIKSEDKNSGAEVNCTGVDCDQLV